MHVACLWLVQPWLHLGFTLALIVFVLTALFVSSKYDNLILFFHFDDTLHKIRKLPLELNNFSILTTAETNAEIWPGKYF